VDMPEIVAPGAIGVKPEGGNIRVPGAGADTFTSSSHTLYPSETFVT